MSKQRLDVLIKTLRPISKERLTEIIRARTAEGRHEELAVQDAGLDDEVRKIVTNIRTNHNSDRTG